MNYLLALFLIGLAILVHEFGHFLTARAVKIPIKAFSVGFGPVLLRKQLGSTEYRLSLIPIGGYVMPAVANEQDYFNIPAAKRIFMAAGGPAASMLLPLFCFAALNLLISGPSWENLLVKPFVQTYSMTLTFLKALPQVFSQPGELAGVVGIVALGGNFIGHNPLHILSFLAVISLNLFILNLLPIPALDGGKILLHTAEKIHPVFLRLHFPLSIAGWIIIISLTIITVFTDIKRLAA